jgi:hypothetical protein
VGAASWVTVYENQKNNMENDRSMNAFACLESASLMGRRMWFLV